jgi:hypothetical protein
MMSISNTNRQECRPGRTAKRARESGEGMEPELNAKSEKTKRECQKIRWRER